MKTAILTQNIAPSLKGVFHVILGSCILAGLSQIEVKIGVVPVTLQTLGVLLLVLFQGKRKATLATSLYLLEATCGFPVLSGGYINPLWMVGPTAGYLIAFPFAAFLMGTLLEKKDPPSFKWMVLSLASGQLLIYLLGVSFLSMQIGFQNALACGLFPFLWIDLLKNLCAASVKGCYRQLREGGVS